MKFCFTKVFWVVLVYIGSSTASDVKGNITVKDGRSLKNRNDFVHERGPYEGGDMVIPAEQKKLLQNVEAVKSGIIGQRYRWAGGRVYFHLDRSFNQREQYLILQAMSEIQNKTCIRFFWKYNNSPNWVYIRRGGDAGCWSYVGKQGGGQLVNLQAPYCLNKGTIVHELMHAIGFFHEQSRPDRDSYVTVNWNNIHKREHYNFVKYPTHYVETQGFGYDYKSIMHYSGFAFAVDQRIPTLYPKKAGMRPGDLGQYRGLTKLDAAKINAMYKSECGPNKNYVNIG